MRYLVLRHLPGTCTRAWRLLDPNNEQSLRPFEYGRYGTHAYVRAILVRSVKVRYGVSCARNLIIVYGIRVVLR